MELVQAIALIDHPYLKNASPTAWADLGCGQGTFTKALASLLTRGSHITGVDSNKAALSQVPHAMEDVIIETMEKDFVNDELPLHDLDGILMANALHFVKDKHAFLQKAKRYLKPEHQFLIVEYEMSKPNPWVPYPIGFGTLKELFLSLRYNHIVKTGEIPSRYQSGIMYAALIS